jgi:hypothetical protein
MNFLLTYILTYILACRNGRRDLAERSNKTNSFYRRVILDSA